MQAHRDTLLPRSRVDCLGLRVCSPFNRDAGKEPLKFEGIHPWLGHGRQGFNHGGYPEGL